MLSRARGQLLTRHCQTLHSEPAAVISPCSSLMPQYQCILDSEINTENAGLDSQLSDTFNCYVPMTGEKTMPSNRSLTTPWIVYDRLLSDAERSTTYSYVTVIFIQYYLCFLSPNTIIDVSCTLTISVNISLLNTCWCDNDLHVSNKTAENGEYWKWVSLVKYLMVVLSVVTGIILKYSS